MGDITTNFEQLAERKNFSVLDAIKGKSYPTDSVTVYYDTGAAHLVKVLEAQAADTLDPDEADQIHEQIEAQRLKVRASKLVFDLRGFDPGVGEEIRKIARKQFPDDVDQFGNLNGEAAQYVNFRYIAESIVRVTDAEGQVDESRWDFDQVSGLYGLLPADEFDKIAQKAFELSFASLAFDQIVDADF